MTEEESYELVLEEMRVKPPTGGLWLKAIAHSNGDENSARAKYMLFRAKQLRGEHRIKRVTGARDGLVAGGRYAGNIGLVVTLLFIAVLSLVGGICAFAAVIQSFFGGGVESVDPRVLVLGVVLTWGSFAVFALAQKRRMRSPKE